MAVAPMQVPGGAGTGAISQVLDKVLARDPGRHALLAPSGTLTYEELDGAADAAAAALRDLGVRPGDRVAASLPNDLDIVIAFHGAMRLGAVWVGLNRNLAPAEKEILLAASNPAVLLADPEVTETHRGTWRAVPCDPAARDSGWPAAVSACQGAKRPTAPDPAAAAGIAFTSGTTGLPKGIVHSQWNLLLPAAALVATRGYDSRLRKGDCLALTILNLQVLTTLVTTTAGGCCVLTDRRDAPGLAEWIERNRLTVWNGVPAMLYNMVHDEGIRPEQLASLQEVWTGGGPCPEPLYRAFRSKFAVPLRQSYGLTEAPTVVTMEAPGDEHREGSSGPPLPHLRVDVRDDDGHPLPAGEAGEVVVGAAGTGPWAGLYKPMLGYWRDDRVERVGWEDLRTGDVGVLDADGNLYIRDRKKLLIIRGGANVYPAEVEQVIEALEGVRASAVLGVADDRLGQRVVAAVEVETGSGVGPEQVVAHCRDRLAGYKVPEQVALVGELPRNAMGKVQRDRLASIFDAGH